MCYILIVVQIDRAFHLADETSRPCHYFSPLGHLWLHFVFVVFDVLNSMSGNADRSSDWVSSQNLMLLQTWLTKNPEYCNPVSSTLDLTVTFIPHFTTAYDGFLSSVNFPDAVQLVSVQRLPRALVWSSSSVGLLLLFLFQTGFALQRCASFNSCRIIWRRQQRDALSQRDAKRVHRLW